MTWGLIWLMFALKIPLAGLIYIVWWAIKQEPDETSSRDDDGGIKRHPPHPRKPFPRHPRRGPHGDPAPSSPPRVRTARARTRTVERYVQPARARDTTCITRQRSRIGDLAVLRTPHVLDTARPCDAVKCRDMQASLPDPADRRPTRPRCHQRPHIPTRWQTCGHERPGLCPVRRDDPRAGRERPDQDRPVGSGPGPARERRSAPGRLVPRVPQPPRLGDRPARASRRASPRRWSSRTTSRSSSTPASSASAARSNGSSSPTTSSRGSRASRSIGRLGLIVHATAGFCDPGWKGTLTLELNNLTRIPIKLYPGLPIAQLSFMALDRPALRPYGSPELGSHYQGQRAATESRYEGAPRPRRGPERASE